MLDLPEGVHRVEAAAAWLGLFAEGYARTGRIDTIETEHVSAVALWRMPDDEAAPSTTLPTIAGLLAMLIGPAHARRGSGGGLAKIPAIRPAGRYAYLNFVGVVPKHQRQGLGRPVLAPGLSAANALGVGVHLDTTNPTNLAFYRSLGFAVTGEIDLAEPGPHLWAMWRPSSTGA